MKIQRTEGNKRQKFKELCEARRTKNSSTGVKAKIKYKDMNIKNKHCNFSMGPRLVREKRLFSLTSM